MKKLALAILLLLVLSGTYLIRTYTPSLNSGSGYAAKNICSGYYLSGFAPQLTKSEALEGAASILSNISYEMDEARQSVDTRMFGLFPRRSVYAPGIGCVLLPIGETENNLQVRPLPAVPLAPTTAWPLGSATPAKSARFEALLNEAFAEKDPAAPLNTKALVIIHQGELVAERYAPGVTYETPLLGWSMAKSVTGLMTGLLVKDGKLNIAAPANVPQWQTRKNDPRAEITLDQLLRMSSSLQFDETYSTQTDVTQMLSNERDAGAFAAAMPLIAQPGEIWSYSSGTTNIISGILKRTVGDTLQDYYEFSQKRLFQPLGIRSATFESDPNGTFISSSYFYASARDWARLGQFCLQDGVWKGERLLPEGWMTYLTTPTPNNPKHHYGAHFWLNQNPADPAQERLWPSLPEDLSYMGGFQGQFVIMIPSEDLVIVRLGFTPGENLKAGKLVAGALDILNSQEIEN